MGKVFNLNAGGGTGGLTQAAADERYLQLSGGTLTGFLYLKEPFNLIDDIGNQIRFSFDSARVMMIGDDNDESVEVLGINAPTTPNSAANKQYVDDIVATAIGNIDTILDSINGEVA